MSRFIEDGAFVPEAPQSQPPTANLLLARLGVSFEPADVQRRAVSVWLKDNDPSPRVARELRERRLWLSQTA